MANHNEPTAPWTIKAVPVSVREKAGRYAKMDDLTVAEWLARAVETEANRQDGNAVLAPSDPVVRAAGGLELAMMSVGALQAMAAAKSAGLPVPDAAARDTVRVLRLHVREAGGLAPLRGRKTNGQTTRQIGQTVSGDREIAGNGVAEG